MAETSTRHFLTSFFGILSPKKVLKNWSCASVGTRVTITGGHPWFRWRQSNGWFRISPNEKGKINSMAFAMKRVAADAHLPTPAWSAVSSSSASTRYSVFPIEWVGTRPPAETGENSGKVLVQCPFPANCPT